MNRQFIISLLFCSMALLSSCDYETIHADGEVTSIEYSFSDYNALAISDAFDVYVTFSADTEESIRIKANDNLHDDILVNKSNNTLVIKIRDHVSIKGRATMEAYITTANLESFDISGASMIVFENQWAVDEGKVELSGASELTGPVLANELEIDLSGASSVDFYGNVDLLEAELSGSSKLHHYDLLVNDLQIKLSGASDAYLTINETIDIKASGASVLYYKGDPIISREELSGASEIRNRN